MAEMKITFSMIVFNSDFVLQECLESVYPFAHQILIAEGPVNYWQKQGYTTSVDRTNEIIDNFPDPDGKIIIHHGQYPEKGDQCNALIDKLSPESDYIWNLDADEIFRPQDILYVKKLLKEQNYTSVGFKSLSFYGGFSRYLTGFEENAEFLRIQKIYPGSVWASHRPPQVKHVISDPLPLKHLSFNTLASQGVRMYHYSYVFPRQVKEKVSYYKAAVSQDNCIDDYYEKIYLPWINGSDLQKAQTEQEYHGVHEFKVAYRGDCYTDIFYGQHPQIIEKNMAKYMEAFNEQLK